MLIAGHTWPPDKAGLEQGWALWASRQAQSTKSWSSHQPGGWCSEQCWVLETAAQYAGLQELLGITTEQDAMQRGGRGRRSSSVLYSVTSLRGRRFALWYSACTHTFLAGRAEVWSSQLLPECKALCCGGWSLITGCELTPVEGRE